MKKTKLLIEDVKVWRLPEIPGAEIFAVRNSNRKWREFHSHYTLATNIAGKAPADYRYRGRIHITGPRNVMFLEPGEMHATITPTHEILFYLLRIDEKEIRRLAQSFGLSNTLPHFRLPNDSAPDFFKSMHQFHSSIELSSSMLEISSRFTQCLEHIFTTYTENRRCLPAQPGTSALKKSRDFLIDRFRDNVSIEEVARESGLSRFHFIRAFTKRFGLTPHAFQIHVRICEAMKQLRNGTPISHIDVGFSDQSHLTRHLKRVIGLTPAQFSGGFKLRLII